MDEKRCTRCGGHSWSRLHTRACVPIDVACAVRDRLADRPASMRELISFCRLGVAKEMTSPDLAAAVRRAVQDLRNLDLVGVEGAKRGMRYNLRGGAAALP